MDSLGRINYGQLAQEALVEAARAGGRAVMPPGYGGIGGTVAGHLAKPVAAGLVSLFRQPQHPALDSPSELRALYGPGQWAEQKGTHTAPAPKSRQEQAMGAFRSLIPGLQQQARRTDPADELLASLMRGGATAAAPAPVAPLQLPAYTPLSKRVMG